MPSSSKQLGTVASTLVEIYAVSIVCLLWRKLPGVVLGTTPWRLRGFSCPAGFQVHCRETSDEHVLPPREQADDYVGEFSAESIAWFDLINA